MPLRRAFDREDIHLGEVIVTEGRLTMTTVILKDEDELAGTAVEFGTSNESPSSRRDAGDEEQSLLRRA